MSHKFFIVLRIHLFKIMIVGIGTFVLYLFFIFIICNTIENKIFDSVIRVYLVFKQTKEVLECIDEVFFFQSRYYRYLEEDSMYIDILCSVCKCPYLYISLLHYI